jgi:hypothetical protein
MTLTPAARERLTRAVADAEAAAGVEVVVLGYARADD